MLDDAAQRVTTPLTLARDLALEPQLALLAADAPYTARPIRTDRGVDLLAPLPDLGEQTARRRRWLLARLAAGQPREADPAALAVLRELVESVAGAEGWRLDHGPDRALRLHPAARGGDRPPITVTCCIDGLLLRAPLRLLPARGAPPCVCSATAHVLFTFGADARPARLRLLDSATLTIVAETHLPAERPCEDEIRWVLRGLCDEVAAATPILAALRNPAVALEVAAAHSLPVRDREPVEED